MPLRWHAFSAHLTQTCRTVKGWHTLPPSSRCNKEGVKHACTKSSACQLGGQRAATQGAAALPLQQTSCLLQGQRAAPCCSPPPRARSGAQKMVAGPTCNRSLSKAAAAAAARQHTNVHWRNHWARASTGSDSSRHDLWNCALWNSAVPRHLSHIFVRCSL